MVGHLRQGGVLEVVDHHGVAFGEELTADVEGDLLGSL